MSEENIKNSVNGSGCKRYTIPRKQRLLSEDCQQGIPLDSREARELIQTVHHLTWESAEEFDRNFVVSKIYKVENQVLEREFQTKRTELRDEGRSAKELSEHYAFKAEYYGTTVKEQCMKGLSCNGSSNVLGDGKMGVNVWKCPDLCLKSLKWPDSWTIFLIVFRIVKGRVKPVTPKQPNQDTNLEPTPNYDCHVAKNVHYSSTTDVATLMIKTQYYLYEYNEEGLPRDRPRHCLPFAVIHVNKAFPTQPEIKQLESIPVHLASSDNVPDISAQETKVQYLTEDDGKMAWRGLIGSKESSLGVVAIMAGHKLGLTLWKSFIDVRNKLPLNSLLQVIPGDIRTAWNKPLYYRGHTFSLCVLKPCGPADKFISFIKSLSMRDHAAGVVTVDSGTVMFLVPSSKLSVELGFCQDEEPWRMFCIVRRRLRKISPSEFDTQSCLNTEANLPTSIEPQGLNINLKFEVPNLAKEIQELKVKDPYHPPIGFAFSRSKSVDCGNTTSRSMLRRRVSDTGCDYSKDKTNHHSRLQQQSMTKQPLLSTPPRPQLLLQQQVQQQQQIPHQPCPVLPPPTLGTQQKHQHPHQPLVPLHPPQHQLRSSSPPSTVSTPTPPLLPTPQQPLLSSSPPSTVSTPTPPLLPTPQQPLLSSSPPSTVSTPTPPLLPTPLQQLPQQHHQPPQHQPPPAQRHRRLSPLLPTPPQQHPQGLLSPSTVSTPTPPLLPTPQQQPLPSPRPPQLPALSSQVKYPDEGIETKQQTLAFNNDFSKNVSLFQFDSIPFLEHTVSHEGWHVTSGNHGNDSGHDVIMDQADRICSSNQTKSTQKDNKTVKEDIRNDDKYHKHLHTLVPCTNSSKNALGDKSGETKDNPMKTSSHQVSYSITDNEPSTTKNMKKDDQPCTLQLPSRDHGLPSSRDLSPRSLGVYTKHKETLKRKSSSTGNERENVKKRKLDFGNEQDNQQDILDQDSSRSLSDECVDVVLSEEQVKDSERRWTSGLQVIELVLIEQKFQEIEEKIEILDKQNAFEILDVDSITEIDEYGETVKELTDNDDGVSVGSTKTDGALANQSLEQKAVHAAEGSLTNTNITHDGVGVGVGSTKTDGALASQSLEQKAVHAAEGSLTNTNVTHEYNMKDKIQCSKDEDLDMKPEEAIFIQTAAKNTSELPTSVYCTQQLQTSTMSMSSQQKDLINSTMSGQHHTSTMSSQQKDLINSTMSSQHHTSTMSSQHHTSTISSQHHTSTMSSQQKDLINSTMSSQHHTSTMSGQHHTSTMSSHQKDLINSTMCSQHHTSTISSQQKDLINSTMSSQYHTSTISSQQKDLTNSTMSSQHHTSTMSSQELTNSTSPFLDEKENKTKTSDAPESEMKFKGTSKPVLFDSHKRSISYLYSGSSHLLYNPPPLKTPRLVNANPCITPRYHPGVLPPRIINTPLLPLPNERFCRLPSLPSNGPWCMPFYRQPLPFFPNGFPCRPPFVPRPNVAHYMCYADIKNRVL